MPLTEEIAPQVYLIHCEIAGRPLMLPLLVGKKHALLIDTGCASHVPGNILPAFAEIGLDPLRLSWIINTHCDTDHQGGNFALKQAAPQAILCCGDADREQIESPDAILAQRFDRYRADHGIFYGEEDRQWLLRELGAPQPVDLTLRGGERLRLEDDWELEILHLPGHSHGHLGVLDRRHGILFGGDSLFGSGCLDLEGQMALCPTYLHIRPYLETISRVEAMRLNSFSGCHWPVVSGNGLQAFCRESRRFVEQAESLILEAIAASPEGKSLRELCFEVGPHLGDWPEARNSELCYAFSGHLTDLEARGLIEAAGPERPLRYRMKG